MSNAQDAGESITGIQESLLRDRYFLGEKYFRNHYMGVVFWNTTWGQVLQYRYSGTRALTSPLCLAFQSS